MDLLYRVDAEWQATPPSQSITVHGSQSSAGAGPADLWVDVICVGAVEGGRAVPWTTVPASVSVLNR